MLRLRLTAREGLIFSSRFLAAAIPKRRALSSDLGNVDSTVRADANVSDIRTSTNIAGNLLKKDDVFSARLESLYRELTLIEYTYRNVKKDSLQSADKNAYQDYLDLAEDYEDYLNYVNGVVKNANTVASVLAGMGE